MSIFFLFVVFWAFYLIQVTLINKYWNRKLKVVLKFKNNEIFEGDSTELLEEISNNKLMPVWWLGVQIVVSRFIVFEDDKVLKAKESRRKDFFTLLSYEKYKKSINVKAYKRGYYSIEELVLSSGDLFNIYKFGESRDYKLNLTVYPRIISTPEFNMLLNKLSGEVITKQRLIEDPFTFRGIRDYTINDSLKLVNWNATARSSEMKVNQYDYTASREVLILLNTEKFNDWDSEVLLEESIRLAASLAAGYIEKGIPVGMISNCTDMLSKAEVQIKAKSGRTQTLIFLETLAKLEVRNATRTMKEIIENERGKISKSSTIILISYYYDKELLEQYKLVRNTNIDAHWVLPKLKNEEVKIACDSNLIVWDVSEDERRIL
jgi:uncharacterized protein (DUF58 family)